jgi:hypothetical protein
LAGAAIAASAWVMDLSHLQAPRPAWDATGSLLNVVPSLLVGFLGYLALARWAGPAAPGRDARRAHLRRSRALYVVVLVLGVLLLHDGGSPDFWSFGQLVLWPWVTAVAGVLADGLTALRGRGHSGGL